LKDTELDAWWLKMTLEHAQGLAPVASDISDAQISTDTASTPATVEENGFSSLGLAPELMAAILDLGYTQPTEVQTRTIPLALPNENSDAFSDLMVSSQTGSGKTAAFLLPVLHTLLAQKHVQDDEEAAQWQEAVKQAEAKGEAAPKRPRRKDPTNPRNFKAATPGALVLCPTRELAQQVAHDAIELVKHCKGLRVANVVGGIPYQLQIAKLQNANLVVATPGRLLDLQRSMQIKLEHVQFLVVDEADRMLDLGFSDDLAEINQLTANRHQTLMFSATFAPRIQQLAARVMREPQRIEVTSPQQKHTNIRQVLHWADNATHKRRLLDHLLRDTSIDQAIIFASTQIECDGLANDLQQDGFSAVALHGALSQGLRNRRLMSLRQGRVQFLVATDVAARGIDVPTITHVFNFGLPMKSEDYTHRIGRTGRAGRDGLAITLAEFRDKRKIFDIEAYTRQPFTAEEIEGLEPTQKLERREPGGRRGNGGGGKKFGGKPFGARSFDDRSFGKGRGGQKHFGDRGFGGKDAGGRDGDRGGNFGGRDFGSRDFGGREFGGRDFESRDFGSRDRNQGGRGGDRAGDRGGNFGGNSNGPRGGKAAFGQEKAQGHGGARHGGKSHAGGGHKTAHEGRGDRGGPRWVGAGAGGGKRGAKSNSR
jgi:superfamily II DNA/RNA helicase